MIVTLTLNPAVDKTISLPLRTLHTLMPSMILRDGRPYLVFGTMGGEGQPQTQTALVARLIDFGYDVQQAVEAPRWLWGQAWGDPSRSLKLEARFPEDTVEELRRRGHEIDVLDAWTELMGHAQQILIDPDNGVLPGGGPQTHAAKAPRWALVGR